MERMEKGTQSPECRLLRRKQPVKDVRTISYLHRRRNVIKSVGPQRRQNDSGQRRTLGNASSAGKLLLSGGMWKGDNFQLFEAGGQIYRWQLLHLTSPMGPATTDF